MPVPIPGAAASRARPKGLRLTRMAVPTRSLYPTTSTLCAGQEAHCFLTGDSLYARPPESCLAAGYAVVDCTLIENEWHYIFECQG